MIKAEVIEDSVSLTGERLTTMKISLPKVLLAEFNTHRKISKNFSSSRAIPVGKVVQMPAWTPVFWGENQAGMQSKDNEISQKEEAERIWFEAIEYCKQASEKLLSLGLHKQWSNRLNDWWVFANGICSATSFENFYWLRDEAHAQPEMQLLAQLMRKAQEDSKPKILQPGEWHLPFITEEERNDSFFKMNENSEMLRMMSAARTCRVSYNKHDGGIPSVSEDLILFDKLVNGHRLHASPLEHQATPDVKQYVPGGRNEWMCSHLHGNFDGWIQFRKIWEYKNVA